MVRHGPRGSFGEKALNRQILIVGYLQWVERKNLHVALRSTAYRKNLHVALRSTAYRASTPAVCEWYRHSRQEWHLNLLAPEFYI
jgi:hypothetical protein